MTASATTCLLLALAFAAAWGLAGYALSLFLKHAFPPRRSWRRIVKALDLEN